MRGAPVLSDLQKQGKACLATIREASKNIVAIEIDFKSKYCEVGMYSGGVGDVVNIHVLANKKSLYLNPKVHEFEPTAIAFTAFVGWDIFTSEFSRYTLCVCLIKKTTVINKKK